MYQYKVFSLTSALIMYIVFALCTTMVFCLLFISPLPLRAYIIGLVLLLSSWGGLTYYILDRLKFKLSISGYTKHGVIVKKFEALDIQSDKILEIERSIDKTIGFWSAFYPDKIDNINKSLVGNVLTFEKEKILLPDGRLARGLQSGESIRIVWNDEVNWSIVTNVLVPHEFSHVILEAIGIDAGDYGIHHHKIFAEKNLLSL